jgi:hypothetical protein
MLLVFMTFSVFSIGGFLNPPQYPVYYY